MYMKCGMSAYLVLVDIWKTFNIPDTAHLLSQFSIVFQITEEYHQSFSLVALIHFRSFQSTHYTLYLYK